MVVWIRNTQQGKWTQLANRTKELGGKSYEYTEVAPVMALTEESLVPIFVWGNPAIQNA
ncbi:MAG: hypothetical protein ACLRZG_08880 [Streptococcus sp.]